MKTLSDKEVVFEKLPPRVKDGIEEYLKYNTGKSDEKPKTVGEILHVYLLWNGIIGYTNDILNVINTVIAEREIKMNENVLTLFERRSKTETIEEHLAAIKEAMSKHEGISKAVTILIDEKNGQWFLHPIYCNTTNGDVFMALRLMENKVLSGVQE